MRSENSGTMGATTRVAAAFVLLGLTACVTEDTTVTTKARVEVVAVTTNFVPPADSPVAVDEPAER